MTETAADELDLAKALDSVASTAASTYGSGVPATTNPVSDTGFHFEETPTPSAVTSPFTQPTPAYLADDDTATPAEAPLSGPLEAIKKDALVELRPLVDKLNVTPEEKFDTYLLLIRSTDDQDLIAPAHEAAKAIEDETKRAEALLDIIKEIDYLSHPKSA
ncbi:MAG: hypothetical protein JWN75_899 [Candidatus Saccharibacteria bacterium]|nr:hypothetical protein [Candidatus Saccharibacteria bacterium]